MNNRPFVKCAAPECNSGERDGHVCTYHSSSIYDRAPWRQRPYLILAVDPDREHVTVEVPVRAISEDEAKRTARVELAKDRRDHWSIRCAPSVQQQATAA